MSYNPSDLLQHIQFEGCEVCVVAPEDYDALIADHDALVAGLEARLRWIPVTEQLPPELQHVAVVWNDSYGGSYALASREGDIWYSADPQADGFVLHDVTHWMPLPAPPATLR